MFSGAPPAIVALVLSVAGGLHLELDLSPANPEPGHAVVLRVTLSSTKPTHLLAYADENALGGRGFLTVNCLASDGRPASVKHPARFSGKVSGSPKSIAVTPAKPHVIIVRLDEWFNLLPGGTYSVTASYQAVAGGPREEASFAAVTSLPIAFSIVAPEINRLGEGLSAADAAIRQRTLQLITKTRAPPGTIRRVEELLSDGNESVRAEAAAALGRLEAVGALPSILIALNALPAGRPADELLYREALVRLGRYDRRTLLDFAEMHLDGQDLPLAIALEALARLQAVEAVRVARQALASRNERVQVAAAELAGQARDGQAVQRLLELYRGPADLAARQEFLRALGRIGDEQALPVFQEALRSGNEGLITMAAHYGGLLENAKLADDLVPLLDHSNFLIRQYTYPTLAHLTGCKLGFDFDGPVAERKYQAEQWRIWWQENRKNFFEPVQPELINYMLSAFCIVIGIYVIGLILGLIKESSWTRFILGGGKFGRKK